MPKYPKNHKDVEYRVPGRKSRVAGSTKATSDFLAAVHEEHPAATIAELRATTYLSRRPLPSWMLTSRLATAGKYQIGGN